MNLPIILTAFGTTESAFATYNNIEQQIQAHFPESDIFWGFSPRATARERAKPGGKTLEQPEEILQRLASTGHPRAIVQPLHLFPGTEFHTLYRQLAAFRLLDCLMGPPLLHLPEDYRFMFDILAPIFSRFPDHAIVVIVHGTRHASWPLYLGFEHMLRHRFGDRLRVGVIEHYPDSSQLETELQESGYTQVLVVPFFIAAGLHYHRDIAGDAPGSWRSRLEGAGLKVELRTEGLGMLNGIGTLAARHIEKATGLE